MNPPFESWLSCWPFKVASTKALRSCRTRADAGYWGAARSLPNLLAKHGRVDELEARTHAGDGYAARRLAGLLTEQGRVDEAITILRARAHAGDDSAANDLVDMLAEQRRVDELWAIVDDDTIDEHVVDNAIRRLRDLRVRLELGRAPDAPPPA